MLALLGNRESNEKGNLFVNLSKYISRNENTSVGVPCKDREWAATLEGARRSTCADYLHERGR